MLVAIGLLQGLAPIVGQRSSLALPRRHRLTLSFAPLASFAGFIAQSISWSWEQIKSYDKGQGVILSATWALPVALIPRVRLTFSTPPQPQLGLI